MFEWPVVKHLLAEHPLSDLISTVCSCDLDGEIYAVEARCLHCNGPSEQGQLRGNIIEYP
ncbi:MAG: hypothetical protein ACFB4I_00430 [Cyanophyceae cyanobacterium]